MKAKSAYILLIVLLFLSCKGGDDSYVYPPVKLEFINAQTNSSGNVSYLQTDQDTIYDITNDRTNSKLDANTLERVVCYYTVLSKASSSQHGTADLYSILKILSPTPGKLATGYQMKTDPVGIQSVWLSGKYINMTLQVKLQSKSHLFNFIENSISLSQGTPAISLTLYHDKSDDVEAYTKIAYLSVPLQKYIQQYPGGFNVSISINTYNGVKTYTFKYIP